MFSMTDESCRLEVKHLGLEAAREAEKETFSDVKFEPKGDTSLDEPKEGEHDPSNDIHQGGRTWAGGVSTYRLVLANF
jgi:hypothetical protein